MPVNNIGSQTPALPGAAWKDTSTVATNTPLTVFTPAANVRGAIVWSMEAADSSAAIHTQVFIAKNGAPANTSDGDVIAQSIVTARSDTGTTHFSSIKRENPTRIAPGLGLYFMSSAAGNAGWMRSCRYTLL